MLLFLAVAPVCTQAVEPDWTQYYVPLAASPLDGAGAAATFPQRAQIYTKFLACGQENEFLSLATQDPSTFIDDNILNRAMAKLQWLKLGNTDCSGLFNVRFVNGTFTDFFNNIQCPDPTSCAQQMAQKMELTFGAACKNASFAAHNPVAPSPFVIVDSQISGACLQAQINFVLSQVQEGDAFPGTDGLPCNIVGGSVHGDWDMRMKTLIRILFLDSMSHGDQGSGPVLTPRVRDHIQNDLITVDGGPGPDSYSWTACGDNEKDTGSPQDREDNNSSSNDFWNSIGDFFSWLFWHLLLIALFLGAAGTAVALGGLAGLLGSALIPLGLAAILLGQIPETENHRLMIESTRFLNNQLIIQDLGPGNAPGISSDQGDVRNWLLNKFQEIARNDFNEYNARPYHGFALGALRNLADFSTDADVRNGAQMLIEYSAAKHALGSNQGRRLVPFRRHFAAVDCIDGNPCPELLSNNTKPAEVFNDFIQIGDSAVSLGLLFNGQTQQLPFGSVSAPPVGGALGDAFPAATSQFLPNPLITDLAIRKGVPYFQRIHHAGYEIYSSGPTALITAGGIETDHASKFSIGPLGIVGSGPDDLGAGLPTTVILTGDPAGVPDKGQSSKMTLDAFISFRGTRKTEGSNEETFTDNLCVWRNFACGTNLRIPTDLYLCLNHDPQTGPHWYFVDSSHCPGYSNLPNKFFLVFFLICPQDICNGLPANNAGFLEVVDNPSDPIAVFESKVITNNSSSSLGDLGQGCLTGGNCSGRYHNAFGHDLELALRGHQDDSNKTGIISVDGVAEKDLDSWNLAEGDIITSQGDGVITIANARLGSQLILDFSNPNHPCRRTGPNQPCTQQ